MAASRNIVFWDEIDTALDLLIRMNAGVDWQELFGRFVAVNNEHRMVTSRLLFAMSYWLTGTVNFHLIGAIGNLFLVGACAVLILSVAGAQKRIRLGVVLAFLMFQMEHFENFIWSGASIDHFQVVMLALATLAALARRTTAGLAAACVLGLLATFTLAHGSVVWPVGALLLWHQRRWRQLIAWCAGSALVFALFLWGFKFNPGHHISEVKWASLTAIVPYWLALLGGPMTLGDAGFAPVPGLLLLVGFGVLIARGALQREPVVMFGALFTIGALALVAFGRVEIAGAHINSRYMVLGALAWALLIFLLIEMGTRAEKPFLWLTYVTPALAAFNITANVKSAPFVDSFIEVRDRAATRFKQYGEDGRGVARLHPRQGHADAILKIAADRGIYQLPRVSHLAKFPDATPSTHIVHHVDETIVNNRAVTIGGWGMLPGRVSKRGQVYVVLRSEKTQLIFSTVTLQRPDVATAYNEPKWRLSGFRAVITRPRLPAEDFAIGVLIVDRDRAKYVMTDKVLQLSADASAIKTSQSE